MDNWFGRLFSRGNSPLDSEQSTVTDEAEQRSTQSVTSFTDAASFLLAKHGLGELSAYVSPKNAMGISTFFGCVKLISNVLATLPYSVYRRLEVGGSERDAQHALDYVIHTRFNPHMSSFIGRRTMVTNLLVYGWSVSEVVRNGGRQVTNIIPYPSKDIDILHDSETDRYFFYHRTKNKRFSEDDVIFLKDLSLDGNVGCSIMNWQKQTIEIDLLAKAFVQKYYKSGTYMDGFFSTPLGYGPKDEDASKEFKKRLKDSFDGKDDGMFAFAVLGQGVDWHSIGKSPVDAQMMPLFEKSDADIAKMFGVPLSMIGDSEKSTSFGTGIEQQYIGVSNNVFVPIAVQIEQEIDYKCFRKDEVISGFYTKHNFKGLLRGDLKTQADYNTKMVNSGISTPDEVRAMDEKPPLPGKVGAEAYMNGTMTPMSIIKKVKTPAANKKSNGKEDPTAGAE